MTESVADSLPDDGPPDDSPGPVKTPDGTRDGGATAGRRSPPARAWALTLIASTIAGLASWLVLEIYHDRLQPGLLNTPGIPTAEEANAAAAARVAAYTLEATLAFGSLGAALGLALGVAGGAVSRSFRRALIAAISGAFLGAIAGGSVAGVFTPIFFRWYNPDSDTLILAIAIQAVICSAIGASTGATFGIGLGGRIQVLRAAFGGLFGAILGVLLFQIVAALAFPLDGTSKPISATWITRLFARLAVANFAAVGALKFAWPWPAASNGSPTGPGAL
jgi:hypothetical protein